MDGGIKWLALCAALALGEYTGFRLSRFAELWPLAAFATVVFALVGYGLELRRWPFVAVFLFGFTVALAASDMRTSVLESLTVHTSGKPVTLRLCPRTDARRGFRRDRAVFPSEVGSVKLLVVIPVREEDALPLAGERWECRGWVERADADDPSRRRRFWVSGTGTYAKKIEDAAGAGFESLLARARRELSRRMGIGIEEPSTYAALNRAILLGERAGIDPETRRSFVDAGTIHVFAISGLHVMLVARVFLLFSALLLVPYRFRSLVSVPLLWLYVALTGASPSAIRAAMMASFHFSASLYWRRPDSLVSWAQTFLIVYGLDPMTMYDVGAALSFAVMLALVLWGRFTARFLSGRRLSVLVMTFAAWAAGTPIAAHVFGRFTPAGIFANLIMLPAAGVSVCASLTGLLASFVSETLAAHINNFAALATGVMASVSGTIAGIPGASFDVSPWPLGVCVIWYAVSFLLLFSLTRFFSARRRLV